MADNDSDLPTGTDGSSTDEKDFGRTDRYANKDRGNEKEIDFTTTGDGTAWDTGRNSSITNGTRLENDLREADAESPGVTGPKPGRE